MANLDMAASAVGAEMDMGKLGFPRGQIENWGDSGVVVTSLRTDTSTDVDADERNQAVNFCAFVWTLDSFLHGSVLWACLIVFGFVW